MMTENEQEIGVSVHDVAAYILQKCGEMSAMKLQKLVYYSQAWSLVWDERPLFSERIEAWIGGPIVPALFAQYEGTFSPKEWSMGDADALDDDGRETIDVILKGYGNKNAQELHDLTHREDYWKAAREGLAANERGNREITHGAMYEFYEALRNEPEETNEAVSKLIFSFESGVEVQVPSSAFPRLQNASSTEIANWRVIRGGRGVRWEKLDEDISIECLVQGNLTSVEIRKATILPFSETLQKKLQDPEFAAAYLANAELDSDEEYQIALRNVEESRKPISPYSREYRDRTTIDPSRFSVHSWGDRQKTSEEVIAENAKQLDKRK